MPNYNFIITNTNNQTFIFDEIRKKHIKLTPEEWVRQNFIKFLINEKNFNPLYIAVEKEITVLNIKKRFDIVIYSPDIKPVILIECKAPDVKLTQSVFNQIAAYNISLKVDYLIVTNGIAHYCCLIDYNKKSYEFLNYIPEYSIFKTKKK
ncbi:MAG: type I restriction enzyme HsdR N-terminal domain-containing protein [Marinilabiliales bacterium]